MHGGHEKCIKKYVGKPEGKGPLGKCRCGWKYDIKADLQEIILSVCVL